MSLLFGPYTDFPQMQCVRTFVAQQPDELSLEKADIILVHQQSSDSKTNLFPSPSLLFTKNLFTGADMNYSFKKGVRKIVDLLYYGFFFTGWVEGTKLSDRQRGWVKADFLETITNPRVRNRNLTDAQKLTTATAAV